jgi:hypothetical protein
MLIWTKDSNLNTHYEKDSTQIDLSQEEIYGLLYQRLSGISCFRHAWIQNSHTASRNMSPLLVYCKARASQQLQPVILQNSNAGQREFSFPIVPARLLGLVLY